MTKDKPDDHPLSLPPDESPTSGPSEGNSGRDAPQSDRDRTGLSEPLPNQIGPYRILELLGEGGMGVVYLVEQRTPVRRRVALKVIKVGMDTKQVIARFEAERQALALMSHAGIARVLDAGATAEGRPYFAMEYVPGIPITKFCDQQRLSMRQRLELFVQVCEAIQHAHQKGIIHRDIKPSNVLVTDMDGDAVPKVIDFGVAKATSQRLTENTIYTQHGMLIGTPEYMSPEQAEMSPLDVDTRTDVYSLGVLLYELLIGALPLDPGQLRRAAIQEMQRIIREQEPPSLSSRLSSLGDTGFEIAERRRTDLGSLLKRVKGDLGWITWKTLEKDRARRYSSAAELAADIHRHLRHEPVVASPPSKTYRVGKFVRRHRVGVGAAVTGLLALLVGLAASTVLYLRAEEQRAIAEAINEFLNNDLLAAVAPEEQGREVTMREVLDATSGSIEGKFPQQPLVEASIRHTLGKTYRSLGEFEPSERHLRVALVVRREQLGEEHPDTLSSMAALAATLWSQGDLAGAQALYEEVSDVRRQVFGPKHPDTLGAMGGLAATLWEQGDLAGAQTLLEEILDVRRQVLGPEHPDTLWAIETLGTTLWSQGDLAGARALQEEALDVRRQVLGPEHPDTLLSMSNLAATLWSQGDLEGARELEQEVLDVRRRVLGPEHPDTLWAMKNLATTLREQGQLRRAGELLEQALRGYERTLGTKHRYTASVMWQLAETLRAEGNDGEAEALVQRLCWLVESDEESLSGREREIRDVVMDSCSPSS